MTRQGSLKKLIRERMKKTGERYTAARAMILRGAVPAASPTSDYPGLLPGYDRWGGVMGDTALLARALAHTGLRHPETGEPYSEAMVNGLCGGVGFLYAVFEYQGWPPMLTMVLRSRSMPQTFVADLFDRVGATREVSQTGSEAVAARALDAALEAGRPAVCMVDAAHLPWSGVPQAMSGAGPHHVAVIGADGESLWIDDRALRPLAMDRADFAKARGAYRQAKRLLFTVAPAGKAPDWRARLLEALADTVRTMNEGDPTVPASFRVNCGFAGLEKWRALLVDARDKKGWPRVFTSGDRAYAGLRRVYDCIHHDYTAPAGGRPFYADFLDEAEALLGRPGLGEAASLFREAGERWRDLAELAAGAPDAAVRRACELSDLRAEALDAGEVEAARAFGEERAGLRESCSLGAEEAGGVFAAMAEALGAVIETERAAVAALAAAIA
ncbi:MAG: DUF4872 domain-containing protein [Planctomycetota bacterium]